jgi:cell division septation protein DedD/Flp pilus assembly protein TadD
MKRKTFGKAMLSSLLVATTMVGCNGAAYKLRSSSAAVAKGDKDAAKFAATADKALGARDFDRALESAEGAVALAPQDASYRQLLGRAYVANGRFASAETALTDAMTLGNSDARTIISLALVKVGLGKNDEARSLLNAHTDTLPAADYGLAIAMAGDAVEGVRILSAAIHDESSTARTRQNLAYAYALAGRWKDARVMAGEDLSPLAAAQRVSQWAMMADPAMGSQRVATLMGVSINGADAGQPVALALAPVATDTPQAFVDAASDVPPPPAIDATGMVEVAVVKSASIPAAFSEAPAPVIQAERSPVRTAATDFVIEHKGKRVAAKPVKASTAVAIAAAPVARMQKVAFLKPADKASNWVVQLGAYDNAAIAKERWVSMATVNNNLAAFPVLTSSATVKGKTFQRLAVGGFAGRADAMTMCKAIQANKGQCFVREGAPGATPQRWALATRGRQFASR